MLDSKTCIKCGNSLPLQAFEPNLASRGGRQNVCSGCIAAISTAEWQEKARQQRARALLAAALHADQSSVRWPRRTQENHQR